ncbi:MAG: sel1 repeat family protein [Deltaproteobacteria bacterium]|nr:sel1 repeat family protein [Deltaproteobacteria bacterium]
MKRLVLTIAILIGLAAPAWAGFAEGIAAHLRGDYATALREFRPLAEQGDAAAQYNLGLMYDEGQGVPQDYAEAVRWYRKAAEQGDDNAQYSLGAMYLSGRGVPQDYVRAHMWFNLSAARGHELAASLRTFIAKKMMARGQEAEAQRLARKWKPKKERP